MYHLKFHFFHIGDQVSVTAIPENIYRLTGKRSVVSDPRVWVFKHNPYVDFAHESDIAHLPKLDLIPDCRIPQQAEQYVSLKNTFSSAGQADFIMTALGMPNSKLRHPRLYSYENEVIQPNRIVVHTTGSDRSRDGEERIRYSSGEDAERVMSDDVMRAILNNYDGYEIVQIGGVEDKPLGGKSTNLCGQLNYWEVAKLIAGSARYIGVNSGPMHIANCYPRVDKRIVLQEFSAETLIKLRPGDVRNWLFSWLDPSNTYFNKYEQDMGVTYAYSKI